MTDPAHLAAVHARAFTSHPRPWTAAEFSEFLELSSVILTGDARCFLLGRVLAGEAEILTLATDLPFRRLGLARGVLDTFLTQAAARGAVQAFLEVAEDNVAARALYSGSGFTEAGRRKGYYHSPKGDRIAAVVMTREIGPAFG